MNREDYNFDPMTGERIPKEDYNFDPMTGERIPKEDYNFDPMTGERISDNNTETVQQANVQNEIPIQNEQPQYQPQQFENESVPQFDSGQYQKNTSQGNKIAIILIAVVTVIILAVASCFAGYFLISGHDRKQKPSNPVLTSDAIKWSSVKLNDGEIPNTYESNMPSAEVKGVGTKSSIIDKLRENTDKSLSSLQVSDIDGGVKYYTLEDQILRIDIPAGVNGFKYNRIYYFNNGVLYFGLVYSAANQNQLYFYQGELYRYINEKGEMQQNEFKNDVFKTLGNFAVNEAYSFYDYKTGVKSDRG